MTIDVRAQDDFSCLATSDGSTEGAVQLEDPKVFSRSQSSSKSRKGCAESDYVPVNHIKDEVYAFLEAWEKCAVKSAESAHTSGALENVPAHPSTSPDVPEPMRYLTSLAPPKKFHRTLWRSAARRALRRSSEQAEIEDHTDGASD